MKTRYFLYPTFLFFVFAAQLPICWAAEKAIVAKIKELNKNLHDARREATTSIDRLWFDSHWRTSSLHWEMSSEKYNFLARRKPKESGRIFIGELKTYMLDEVITLYGAQRNRLRSEMGALVRNCRDLKQIEPILAEKNAAIARLYTEEKEKAEAISTLFSPRIDVPCLLGLLAAYGLKGMRG